MKECGLDPNYVLVQGGFEDGNRFTKLSPGQKRKDCRRGQDMKRDSVHGVINVLCKVTDSG